jgi:hypothetical protein
LPLQDPVGVTRLAGVKQQGALLQLGQGFGPTGERLDVNGVVTVEADVIDSAESRRVLVLAADRLLEQVNLDPAGLLGQELMPINVPILGII